MENNKNGHLGESLRKKLENFPEEFPSENNWQHVRSRMLSEGLLRKKSYRKRYLTFLLLLLISGTAVLVSVPFVSKKKNAAVKNIPQQTEVKVTEKDKLKENKISSKNESVKNENEKIVPLAKPKEKTAAAKPEGEIKKSHASSLSNNTKQKNSKPSEKNPQETAKEIAAELIAAGSEAENNTAVSSAGAISEIEITKKEEPAETSLQVASEPTLIETDSASVKNSAEAASIVNDTTSAAQPITEKQDSVQTEVTATKTEPENNSPEKIRLGVFISWDSNKYFLKESDNAEQAHADYILSSDSIGGEPSAAQFTVGIRASYFISKKTAIEAGVYYSQKRKVDATIYTPVYSSASGESVSDYVYHFNAKYFEVDGRIKYYVYRQKPAVYISGGAKGSFNLQQDSPDYYEHTVYSESALPLTERVLLKPASLGLSLVFAAGAEISLNPRCNFFLEPSYTYALDPVINNPDYIIVPVNHFRRGISIGTGLNYKF